MAAFSFAVLISGNGSNLQAIIDASDAVMVARGDLGAEAGIARVPMLQKEIIRSCNEDYGLITNNTIKFLE